jgi:histidyl-tRNA synthetase
MKSTIQSVKGARDFYPEDMALRNWIYQTIKTVSHSFGFQEYDGPYLETVALYAAKSGEELVKENFAFPDRSGDMITLRPELTPSLARMVAQRQRQLNYPLKWWSFGPFWRYERPQKGRSREFFQWNIDTIGIASPEADAELVAIGAKLFKQFGLSPDQVKILVNNRELINDELKNLGIETELHLTVIKLIDRRDKMPFSDWKQYAREIGITDDHLIGILSLLENNELWRKSPELTRFFTAIDALGVKDWVTYAPYIMRGLDYYTGTVFEAWDSDGEFRAILGGGRYDDLVGVIGGDRTPGVGFAMGDVVLGLVLKKFGCVPESITQPPAKILVTVFDESHQPYSLDIANKLREAGFNVFYYPETAKIAKQFKFGDRAGMRIAVVIGPEELSQGKITVKDLSNGEQQTLTSDEAIDQIRDILDVRL